MPELPEVEFTARQLRATVLNATIQDVHVFWERTIGTLDAPTFRSLLAGQSLLEVRRRGKYLLIDLGHARAPELLMTIHRRMTGNLYLLPPGWEIDTSLRLEDAAAWNTRGPDFRYASFAQKREQAGVPVLVREAEAMYYDPADLSHCRVCFDFADGRRLLFNDARKFGRIELWPTEREAEALTGLGPEPLSDEFTVEVLTGSLSTRKGPIKAVLLDQQVVAGLGNIYADEALFLARIHPLRPANSLTEEELMRLRDSIVSVLAAGIEYGGTTFSGYRGLSGEQGENYDHLKAYHRAGESKICIRCGGLIASQVIAQRTAHFCPHCQRLTSE
ncbi:MAG TPA: bifunctional DNA-formamidopyrimidine glycosylase/DNA-(apurinic or apyrimidinic site) lyase [Ktedonobacteraceae bacterium]|nr:bifunctional DNA-formamidopyrimidine glycosylase/DNA-(apurinic or apyrimidinic site) lyase [Ktedonobacteraceae bacterium]